MSDTEMLNLIEYYGWDIISVSGGWCVTGKFGAVNNIILRDAIKAAMNAQFNWSVG